MVTNMIEENDFEHLPPEVSTPFRRAALDRNIASDMAPFREALAKLNLSGLAVIDFGCGKGFLEHLMKNSNADVIYAFEVLPDEIDEDIKAWAADPAAKPRLVINPPEFRIDDRLPVGDMTNYDYTAMLAQHESFAIVANPPYFLFNRILSLTAAWTGSVGISAALNKTSEKFRGGLMLTSAARLGNHPGWSVVGTVPGNSFIPPVFADQYLLQTGFKGRYNGPELSVITTVSQRYIDINDRDPQADPDDFYPEMWQQLEALKPQ
ncbi:MAG TPA: hypothetical protein VIG74_04170 [Alphaproteobacteria bacterium]|jgi:SAM-dependent methyltransferase